MDGTFDEYEEEEGAPDEVVVTNADDVLKAIQDGTAEGVLTLAEELLPDLVERAVVKAITQNEDVQRKIRNIVGGRINKGLTDHGLEPLSKATTTAPVAATGAQAIRLHKGTGRTAGELIEEAQAIQGKTGATVPGLHDFLFTKNPDTYNALLKGIEVAKIGLPTPASASA